MRVNPLATWRPTLSAVAELVFMKIKSLGYVGSLHRRKTKERVKRDGFEVCSGVGGRLLRPKPLFSNRSDSTVGSSFGT